MMKQRFLKPATLLLMGILLVACSTGEGDSALEVSDQLHQGAVATVYEADWVVNRQLVDHTQLSVNHLLLQVGHYPNDHLLDWAGHTWSVSRGGAVRLVSTGLSATSSYFEAGGGVPPYLLTDGDGRDYQVRLRCEGGGPTAVYEQSADRWTLTWHVSEAVLTDILTQEAQRHMYEPAMTLMLMTTKRAN